MPDVLIIEDEQQFATNVATYLVKHGYTARIAATAQDGLSGFEARSPDLILLDYQLGDATGIEVLSSLRRRSMDIPVVLMTAHGDMELAVRAMKAGANDFLAKPVSLGKIHRAVEGTLRPGTAPQGPDPGDEGLDTPQLVGRSEAMQALRSRIETICGALNNARDQTPPAVLISGETGTGKEVAAKLLHARGPRRGGPFVNVNCAAIPPHLLEAEFFGYERGAFTDARTAKMGLVEAAAGGVLFLDEVSEFDLGVQSKLLRMLEERIVRRIGSVVDRRMDCWVVAASNRSMDELVEQGRFRSDLLFRLNALELELPPLRARGDDSVIIAKHLLAGLARRWKRSGLGFEAGVEQFIRRHAWPGNVRELRNRIEQAVLLAPGTAISASQLSLPSSPKPSACPDTSTSSIELPERGLKLEVVERELVLQALNRNGWNISASAKLLGLSRDTLRYRMEKHGLRRAR